MAAVTAVPFKTSGLQKMHKEESIKYRDYVHRELIESKNEASDPNVELEDHNEFINKWELIRKARKNVLYHAEMIAIHQACAAVNDWRLEDCRLFVTVEPCPMCAGAIIQARIPTVVYGAANIKAGCGGSVLNVLNEPRFNHRACIIPGVMEKECSELMRLFFKRFRK